MRGLSLVVASGGHSSSWCADLSLSRPLPLRSTGSRCAGSVVVAHGPSCSAACGIFPDQGSNPCPLHWQADSQPLHHQGSPMYSFLISVSTCFPAPPSRTLILCVDVILDAVTVTPLHRWQLPFPGCPRRSLWHWGLLPLSNMHRVFGKGPLVSGA